MPSIITSTKLKASRPVRAPQCRRRPVTAELPHLVQIIQEYINKEELQKDIPKMLERDHSYNVCLRTLQRHIHKYSVKTVRKCQLTDNEKCDNIKKLIREKDPRGKWGARKIKTELAKQGIHIARDFVGAYLREIDPQASAARRPAANGPRSRVHGPSKAEPPENKCVPDANDGAHPVASADDSKFPFNSFLS